jgi:hypothetical protein
MDTATVGSVEIKVVASERGERAVYRELGLLDLEPERRDVYYFDTPSLRLFDRGLVLRARVIRDGADDSTVKIRPFGEREERRWSGIEDLEVELDVIGDAAVRSAKLGARRDRSEIEDVGAGRRPIRDLFSEEQAALVRIPWDALVPLGPIRVHRWSVTPDAVDTPVVVEEWVLPSADNVVELSIRVEPAGWREAQRRFMAFLGERHIEVDPDQRAKTRWALGYFAGRAKARP